MSKYILVRNGDENLDYPINTPAECDTARAALTAAGESSAAVYVGDPADSGGYAMGERFTLVPAAPYSSSTVLPDGGKPCDLPAGTPCGYAPCERARDGSGKL